MKRSTRFIAAVLAAGVVAVSCDEGRLLTEVEQQPFQSQLEAISGPDTLFVGQQATYSTSVRVGDQVVTDDVIDWDAEPPKVLSFDSSTHTSSLQVEGNAPGEATLIAATDHPDLEQAEEQQSVTVLLTRVAVAAPSSGDTTLTAVGDSVTLRAQGRGPDGATADSAGLTWRREGGSALSLLSAREGRDTLRVAAVGPGTDTLSVRHALCVQGPCVDTVYVRVDPVPDRIVAPDSVELAAFGSSVTPSVTVYDRNDNAITGAALSWALADPADSVYASVTSGGEITAVGNGTADVVVEAGPVSDTVLVSVRQRIHQVSASSDLSFAALDAADTVALAATDSNSALVTRSYDVEWTSRDTAVATARALSDGRAVVTASGTGSVYVVGEAEGRDDSLQVTVAQAAATVTVSPDSVDLDALGAAAQLSVSVQDANGNTVANPSVDWTAVNTGVATVSSSGEVTAVGQGSTGVIATSEGTADTATVVVDQVPASMTVTDATLVAIGESATLGATVRDAGGSVIGDATATWTVVSGGAAIALTAGGGVTAQANGQAKVEGSTGSVADTAVVLVEQAVDSVDIATASLNFAALLVADTVQVTAFDSGGTAVSRPFAVSWSTTDGNVAEVTQLADTVRARIQAKGDGSARIDATVEGKVDSVNVTVAQAVDSVIITAAADTLTAIDATTTLTAEPVDANLQATGDGVTWGHLDAAIATIDAAGTVTAASNGTARFTAAAGGVEDTASVVVRQVAATIDVTPDLVTDTLLAGDTLRLDVSAVDANGYAIPTPMVVWTASPDSVASVDSAGLVRGKQVAALDSAFIKAADGGAADSVELFVNTAVLTSVTVTPATDTLASLNATTQLLAQGLNQNGNPMPGQSFTWQSRNTGVVTVSAPTDSTAVATAVADSQTYVVATSTADPTLSDSALVVVDQVVDSVAIVPAVDTFTAHSQTHTFKARAFDALGSYVANAVFSFTDDLQGLISVATTSDTTADVTAQSNGTAELYAAETGTGSNLADTASVTVTQVPDSIAVTPADTTVTIGTTAPLTAEVLDANGATISGASVDWRVLVSDTAIASVDSTGNVTAKSVGTAQVVANASGDASIADTSSVNVVAYTLLFDGTDDYVDAGDVVELNFTGWTLEVWVKPDIVTGTQYLVAKGGGATINQASYGLYLSGANPAVYVRSGAGGKLTDLVSTSSVTAGSWHHLGATYDGSQLVLYVNGTATDSVATTNTPQDGGSLVFGGSDTGASDPFDGTLDEIRFWNVARTALQISASYDTPLSGTEANLLAYWALDEGSGGTTTDAISALVATLGTATAGDAAEPTWVAESPTIP